MRIPDRFQRVTGDFAFNILASVIYTFARQIVVLPLFARRMTDDEYGTLLTVLGLVTIFTSTGEALNNIRLTQNSRYEERGLRGDFNLQTAFTCCLSVALTAGIAGAFHYNWLTTLLLMAYGGVYTATTYAVSLLQLKKAFKQILLANILTSAGYIVVALFASSAELWPLVYLVGDGVALLYYAKSTRFYREPFSITPLFGETTKKLVLLVLSVLFVSTLSYADRMLIYPVLGADNVSYYSVASLFGKSAGVLMTPVSGVLLVYFSQRGFVPSRRLFAKINGLSLCLLFLFLIGCSLVSPWFTRLLYPTLYAEAAPYIFIANLGALINIAAQMAQPMVLKFCKTAWYLFVQGMYAAAYLVSSLILMPRYGLWGFCFAALLSNVVHLLAYYVIGFWKGFSE